ncbi:putative ubiquitin-conjugating enzyme E2 38 [Bidens hawaiensis]|uniref:putative ubiquitin-conjugating enzyme E2 38 n=1 Tax=Bidens hawaiensis TaxID=980011 RepID=UPI004049EE28
MSRHHMSILHKGHLHGKAWKLVHYNSYGLSINPSSKITGEVRFLKDGDVWVPKTLNVVRFLALLQKFFNATPFHNILKPFDPILFGGHHVPFYNELVFVKSAKTMLALMNKPPKGFEEFVMGYFHTFGNDILSAVNAYVMGVKVGCFDKNVSSLLEGDNETLSPSFKIDLEGCYKSLEAAYKKFEAYYPL